MKKIASTFFLLLTALFCHAEIIIGVAVPNEQNKIDAQAFNMLKTRMQQLIASTGCSSVQRSSLVMYPTVNILNEEHIEGGLRNIYTTELEITLFVYHTDTRTHFGSYSINVKGNGFSNSTAVKNAFANIRTPNGGFSLFMEETKKTICTFFENYQQELLSKANAYAQMQQYEEALALLYSCPEGIDGYNQVHSAMIDIFRLYQSKNGAQIIQQAKSHIAKNDYETALFLLSGLDATAPQAAEAEALIKDIEGKIDSEILYRQQKEDEEKNRTERKQQMVVNAIKDIVVAFCNRQPAVIYDNIF